MQTVNELTLPFLALTEPAFERDPFTQIVQARQEHPWLARCEPGYLVHGFKPIKDILYQDDKLLASFSELIDYYEVQGTPWAEFMLHQIMALSGTEHTRIRSSVGLAFTPRSILRQVENMQHVIARLLDEWVPAGQFDFAQFAAQFPVRVLCGLLGVSDDFVPGIAHALEVQSIAMCLDKSIVPELLAGYDTLWNSADQIVLDREAKGITGDTLLDQMVTSKNDGKITEEELRSLLIILFVAGYDTSKNMLTLAIYNLMQHPEQWERCAADRSYCDKAIEEMFRHTSVASIFRTVTQPLDYDGVHFPVGTVLIFALSVAGRDPTVFTAADSFDPDRERLERHVGFGRGAHICLGQHLAKIQIAEGVHQITRRIHALRITGDLKWRAYLGVWGLDTLPIAFEEAEQAAA